MAARRAFVCSSTRTDVEELASLACDLLDATDADLAAYAEDIAHAYEGIRAVTEHVAGRCTHAS